MGGAGIGVQVLISLFPTYLFVRHLEVQRGIDALLEDCVWALLMLRCCSEQHHEFMGRLSLDLRPEPGLRGTQ